MTLKPPTRTLPKVKMKEWPVYTEMDGSIWEMVAIGPEPDSEMVAEFVRNNISSKSLSDFTRVVEETGVLDQKETQRRMRDRR